MLKPHICDVMLSDEEQSEEFALQIELDALRNQLQVITSQFFSEKRLWLEERKKLLRGDAGTQAEEVSRLKSELQQERKTWQEERSKLENELSRAVRSRSLLGQGPNLSSSIGSLGELSECGSHVFVSEAEQRLRLELAALRCTLDEATRMSEARAGQWNVERLALQRQVEVLQAAAGPASGEVPVLEQRLAAVEEERAALQQELDLIRGTFRGNILVPRAQMSRLTGGAAPSTSGAGPSEEEVAVLQQELERYKFELERYKAEDVVLVARGDYEKLKGVFSERAAAEREASGLRSEVCALGRLNRLLEEELTMIKETHVTITTEEYESLRQAQWDRDALQLKAQSTSKYFAQVPREELAELQAAQARASALSQQLSSLQAAASAGAGEQLRRLAEAEESIKALRVESAAATASSAGLQLALADVEERCRVLQGTEARCRELEGSLAAAQQERARLEVGRAALQKEVAELRAELAAAVADRDRLQLELGSCQDSATSQKQQCCELALKLQSATSRLSELQEEVGALTQELVTAKLELARMKDMEVRMRKEVFTTKVQLLGSPSAEPLALGGRPSGGAGAADSPTPHAAAAAAAAGTAVVVATAVPSPRTSPRT